MLTSDKQQKLGTYGRRRAYCCWRGEHMTVTIMQLIRCSRTTTTTTLLLAVVVLLVLVDVSTAAVAAESVDVRRPHSRRLLLISMDGFRWDYLDKMAPLPNFEKLARQGTKAAFINNTFMTSTFPTHYSIATGLYEESHGLVGNRMYDPDLNALFEPGMNEGRWWSDGEPIWITTTKQSLKTGCVFFPGTEVELQGVRPALWLPYDIDMPFKQRVDTIIDWFVEENIDFGTLYFHEPDASGHQFGPDSPEVDRMVHEMDDVLGYLMERMEAYDLHRSVNMIVTSDHGMTAKDMAKVVEIPRLIDMRKVAHFVDLECVCHVFPAEGQEDALYEALRHSGQPGMTAFRKDDIPDHWHYKHHRRIPPIVLVMDEGWTCTLNKSSPWVHTKGNHGYDNRLMTMKPIFLAQGPDIRASTQLPSFGSVDIYPLMCELLGVSPAPNNGSLKIAGRMLRHPPSYTQGGSTATASDSSSSCGVWLPLVTALLSTYHSTILS